MLEECDAEEELCGGRAWEGLREGEHLEVDLGGEPFIFLDEAVVQLSVVRYLNWESAENELS